MGAGNILDMWIRDK